MERQLGSSLFTYREIISMLLPLILDSFFVNLISVLTTAMISSSSQESVSAVSLVSPLYMMVYAVLNALSTGGTVIVARYKGKGETEKIRHGAGQVLASVVSLSTIVSLTLILFAKPLVRTLFSAADPVVIEKSGSYLIGVAVSLIFLAIYMSVFAVFRGIGETKICLRLTIIINLTHLVMSFVLLNILHLDIAGTSLSLNIARAGGAAVALCLLMRRKGMLHVGLSHILCIDFSVWKSIFRIGVPFALEQIFFNGGSMLVQTFLVTLGTVSIAANAVANSAFGILYAAGMAVGTLSMTVIGQCIGAGKKEDAVRYGKKLVTLGTVIIAASLLLFLPLMPYILRLYQAPQNTAALIYRLLYSIVFPMLLFWSMSNVMPCILRAAGDSAFSSGVSLVTMWTIRVAGGYFLAIVLQMGAIGLWLSMGLEWAVRTVVFTLRYRSGIWLRKE